MDNTPHNTPTKTEGTVPLVAEVYNCQGICDDKTRADVFSWLKSRKKSDITILTETKCHLPNKQRDKWREEWSLDDPEKDSYWSLGTQNSKGVAILIHEKFKKRDAKIVHVLEDPNGRYIKMIIEIEGITYRILGIYAPNNKNQIDFFTGLHTLIKNDPYDVETLMGGDYNCTPDTVLDRINCISNQNDKGQVALRHLCKSLDLEDIWRIRNPNQRDFTWFGPNNKASRIDYWLISASLNGQVNKIESHYFPFSDHHGVKIEIRTKEIQHGKGVWKMNAEHLFNDKYKQEITQLWNAWKQKKNDFLNISQWWDIGKKKIKTFSRNFAIEQSIKNKSRLEELEYEISYLRNSMSNKDRLIELQTQHKEILDKATEGMKIRSRLQWWEEGENSTKFFHGIEKKNGKNKTWEKILTPDGQLVYGTQNVQKEQVNFYKDLFSSQRTSPNKSFFLSNPDPQLSQQSQQNLERLITKDEIANAIKKMPNNKSPGEDGIIIEFYKMFWDLIGDDIHEVFLFGLENEELSYSQYLAVIVLLYKKGARENIKNWRPISLLNVDYKILSKVLAERLKEVLPEIIHQDQKGCVKGRFIGDNIRLLEDIIFEIENNGLDSIILLQDQEKAFDRVEWEWLFATLKYFGFGETFIGWLMTLYKNSQSSIITNGHQSAYFDITRGIRQGDSLSALLYIIQLEPLAQKIRKSTSFDGIKIKLNQMNNYELELKGCQYVDDCNTFLKDKKCIKDFTKILAEYERVSGSKINFDKTKALAVNNLPGSPTEKIDGIELIKGPEKALGIPIGAGSENNSQLWTGLISKVKAKLDFWRLRGLSLQGKTHVIRSIGVSKLLYALEMKTISDEHIKTITDLFWSFLWNGKNVRFSKDICYLPRNMGGLNLVNVKIIEKVKRINCVIRFLKDETRQPWTLMMENHLRCLDKRFSVSLFALKVTDASDLVKTTNIPKFYQECLIYFQELLGIARVNLQEEFIWCNKRYRFNNKPISFPHWSSKGIIRPSQLYTDGELNPNAIFNRLTIRAGFLFEFQTIKRIFPERSDNFIINGNNLENATKKDILDFIIQVPGKESKCISKLTSKDIYNIFLHEKAPPNLSKVYWNTHVFHGQEFDWSIWYLYNFQNVLLPRKCSDFLWKQFYGLLRTESTLKRWGVSNGICRCCNIVGTFENVEHLLINCQYRAKVWVLVQNVLRAVFGPTISISRLEILTGYFKEDLDRSACLVINMIIGMTKHSIWLSRNLIKKENKVIRFQEFYLRIKHYILSHVQLLLLSSQTENNIKTLLAEVKLSLNDIFINNLNEANINDIV